MQTNLAPWAQDSEIAKEAQAILRRCVHCGFCSATCPTYQVLGDELDSPRGRIYLIKQVLEGAQPSEATRMHLDRCLTCRNCETTCPSGVEYGHLVDIGRKVVEELAPRAPGERWKREALRRGLRSPLFAPAMRLGQLLRGVLPRALRSKAPPRRAVGRLPDVSGRARQVLLLTGCVQPAMQPSIDAATIRVLDALGIGAAPAPSGSGAGCCGAIDFHLNAQDDALAAMRANIDAWWPLVESGKVEAIVINASGCGAMVKEYAHHLRHDAAYADKARRIVALVKDVAEIVAPHSEALRARLVAGDPSGDPRAARVAFHPSCTLQHGQNLRGVTEQLLRDLGFDLQPFEESHLCCGSAGTYSVLQAEIALPLRERKLGHIQAARPELILSSNLGCITHLQGGTQTPVLHWVEAVDQLLK